MTAAPSMRHWASSSTSTCCAIQRRGNAWPPSDPRSSRGSTRYIVEGVENLGATLLIPAATFAHIIIATTDAVELGSHLDDVDLYQAMVEMYVSAVKMP